MILMIHYFDSRQNVKPDKMVILNTETKTFTTEDNTLYPASDVVFIRATYKDDVDNVVDRLKIEGWSEAKGRKNETI